MDEDSQQADKHMIQLQINHFLTVLFEESLFFPTCNRTLWQRQEGVEVVECNFSSFFSSPFTTSCNQPSLSVPTLTEPHLLPDHPPDCRSDR